MYELIEKIIYSTDLGTRSQLRVAFVVVMVVWDGKEAINDGRVGDMFI